MSHRTNIITNLMVNSFTAYNDIGKLYTKYQFYKMMDNLDKNIVLAIGKENFQIVGQDDLCLIINGCFKNYNNEIQTLNNTIGEYFPFAEGTQVVIEDEQYTPTISIFTRDGIFDSRDLNKVKFEMRDKTVIPYRTTIPNTNMSMEDLNETRRMLQNNDFTNAEQLIKKYIIF